MRGRAPPCSTRRRAAWPRPISQTPPAHTSTSRSTTVSSFPTPPPLPSLHYPHAVFCAGYSVVGDIYVVAAALSAAAAPSSLTITASVVENGVDTAAQHDSPSRTFKQPPRAGRSVPAAAATQLLMGRNYSVVVAKGAYAYWSLDVTPGYELRCSLQVRTRYSV